jgi:hypothetical protein
MLKYCNVYLGLLLGHYYSNSTQAMINVTAHSDIFLSHLTNTDMKYVISYASVLLLQTSCHLLWCPKPSNPSILIYHRLKNVLVPMSLLIIIILFLLKQYEIFGQDSHHRGCCTYIQMHCECSCASWKECVMAFFHIYMFETNFNSCVLLHIYFRYVKVIGVCVRNFLT